MGSGAAQTPLGLFHLLVGEDGEPICVGFGPKRSDCKTVAMISGTYKYYSMPDRERGLLMHKLVEAANAFLVQGHEVSGSSTTHNKGDRDAMP